MLTIRPIEQKQAQQELCEQCGVEYRPDTLAYSCYEADKLIGVCQFFLHSGGVYLADLSLAPGVEDDLAQFLMGRAALNFADLAGFHDAYYPAPEDEALAGQIGFRKNSDGVWYMNLRNFIISPCSNDK